ncbi:esterase FrsA [Erwinia billingiae]|uniref:esterase FrsA n=1 Tax=Erwinia billingiae TaxID=182337 RepID=UPI002247D98B|nr:esterase FrsA [Erwinia billingiae]MCX0498926.1 esterase FrsA [Erwinia billingiae]
MSPKNLSEELFKPRFKHPETSSLVRRLHHHKPLPIHSALEGDSNAGWYRMINRLLWTWRGITPQEISEVLARIAVSRVEHTDDQLLDTVVGYRGGNWIYEWSKQAALWQKKAGEAETDAEAGQCWLHAANLYGIAGYPHLKGDELAEQAQVLANRAYEEATPRLSGELKELEFAIPGGSPIFGFLHMPPGVSAPYPTVLLCGSLDSLQTDHYRLFHDYLAPRGIAMLTIDMPSVGFSAKWKLTQDASFLHQHVLRQLENVPWVDHQRVGAFGYRFGANVAVRLAYLEAPRLRAVACLGPVVHSLLCDQVMQDSVPEMYMDVLASRLGMATASDSALRIELNRYSLKMQGLLGRRCPTPMLSGYWPNDPFSPEEESRLIVNSSADGKLMPIPLSPAMLNFDKALRDIVDWLAKRLTR